VLKSSKHSRKGVSYMFLHEWLGTGLLTSAGAKWKLRYGYKWGGAHTQSRRIYTGTLALWRRRRMITPSFHFEVLRGFVQTFGEQAAILVKLLDAKADTGECTPASPLHVPTFIACVDEPCALTDPLCVCV
jgi:hypothetical protein